MYNDVLIYMNDEKLGVSYGVSEGAKDLVLPFETTTEAEIVNTLLNDPNFWVQFLSAVSAALKRPANIEESSVDPEAN